MLGGDAVVRQRVLQRAVLLLHIMVLDIFLLENRKKATERVPVLMFTL